MAFSFSVSEIIEKFHEFIQTFDKLKEYKYDFKQVGKLSWQNIDQQTAENVFKRWSPRLFKTFRDVWNTRNKGIFKFLLDLI